MSPEERRRKLQEIAAQIVERLDREWPAPEAHVNDREDLAERVGRELMREVTETLLHERAPRRAGNQSACDCGGRASYRGQQPLTLVTAHGRIPVERAYFYCEPCRQGHCPRDREWGLGPAHTTPTVQALVADLAAEIAYTGVPQRLRRWGWPIHLGVKSVELIAQRLGERVQADPQGVDSVAQRPLAVAVDGVMLPTRGGYKEARSGVVYEPDWEAGRTPEECHGLRKEYVGTLESREELVRTVAARVERRRPTPATKVSALGDGAHWIWEQDARHLPHRVEILDFYHACEPLGNVAAARYGVGTPQASAWVKRIKGALRRHGPALRLRSLRRWQPDTEAAREVKRQAWGYFTANEARMNYPEYLRAGWPLGSGAVEGACKHLVTERFKKTGMRWNKATAEPLLHLRAALLTQPDLDLRRYVS
jgi:hypothetical protein